MMKLKSLGGSGLLVSPICLGTMTFGKPVAEAEGIGMVHQAMDLGVNFFDTANVYEGYDRVIGSVGGTSETIVGKAIKDRRDKVVLATKVGAPNGPGPQDAGASASHILREVDRSLQRLQTDYIDLYILHWPDRHTPLDASLRAIDVAVRQGKVRCFGVSNHWAAEICELLWLADKGLGPKVVSSQIPYSLLRREYHNDLEFCRRHNISVTPYQALQGGILTGKYRRNTTAPKRSRAAEKPEWVAELDDAFFDKLDAIRGLADEVGVHVGQYVLAWTLAQPAINSLVLGATNIEQVKDAVAAAEITIPPEILAKQDKICPPPWQNLPPFVRVKN